MAGATKKSERIYVAISAEGVHPWTHKPNWYVELVGDAGETPEQVEEKAQRSIAGDQWDKQKDIWTETNLKNLHVVTLSAAKRAYSRAWRIYTEGLGNEDPEEM